MSLTKIIEEIKTVRPLAEEDVEDGNINTLNARRGRQRAAAEKLKTLNEQYARELLRSTLFIVVTGSDNEAFAALAEEKFECFSADAEGLYKELADAIHPTLYEGKESVSNIFDVLGRVLEDKALALGLQEYPQLTFKAEYRRVITNKAQFQDLIRQAINEQVGGELVGIHAVRGVAPKAVLRNHEAKITPVILRTDNAQLAVELPAALERLTSKVFLVAAGKTQRFVKNVDGALTVKETSEESVQNTLTTIRNSIKK